MISRHVKRTDTLPKFNSNDASNLKKTTKSSDHPTQQPRNDLELD